MDGTILHFDRAGANGLIRASDGNRYSFNIVDWKSDGSPDAGDLVDFEIAEGQAIEIYRIGPGAITVPTLIAERPLPAPASSGGDVRLYLASRPGLPFAVLILLGCFLPFNSTFIPNFSPSLFNYASAASFASYAPAAGYSTAFNIGLWMGYLLYAIPVVTVWLIAQEFRGEGSPALRLRSGIIGLAGPIVIVWLSNSIAFSGPEGASLAAMTAQIGLSVGFGWLLIGAASIALIAVGRGWAPFGQTGSVPSANPPPMLDDQPETATAHDSEAVQDDDWTYSDEEPKGRFSKALRRAFARVARVLALLWFVLPWASLSSSDVIPPYVIADLGKIRGSDLLGGHLEALNALSGQYVRVFYGPSIMVLAALTLIVASLILSFFARGRKARWITVGGCGGAVLLLLWEVVVIGLSGVGSVQWPQSGMPGAATVSRPIEVSPEFGFWLVLATLVGAILLDWNSSREEDEWEVWP